MGHCARSNPVEGHQFSSFLLRCLLIALLLLASGLTQSATCSDVFSFYAIYDRVADMQALDLSEIFNSAMSADGQRLVVYGRSRTTSKIALYTINIGGQNRRAIPLPESIDNISGAAINGDGSRIFLRHHWDKSIYKLEGGRVSKIFDADDFKTVDACDQIETTYDGDWVYFNSPRQGIWRVSHQGGTPQYVVRNSDIIRDGGRAGSIPKYAVSANGRALIFIVDGYFDSRSVFHSKHEVFVAADGRILQLSNDERHIYKSRLAISGNGQAIAYSALAPQNTLWIVRADGSNRRQLDNISDVGDVALNHDGSRLFYYDPRANGGRMVYTDGSGSVDLFPLYNVRAIALHASGSLMTNEAGDRIAFRFQDGVYAGYFGRADIIPDAPVIHEIWFEPSAAGKDIYARISDPDGRDDIMRTNTNELLAGHTEGNGQKLPIHFYSPVNDDGVAPDKLAKDGIFSSAGHTGGTPDAIERTRIRVSVMDRSYTVVVADVELASATATVSMTPAAEKMVERRLSAEQRRILSRYGNPDAFEMAYEPFADDSREMMVTESWRYFAYLTSFEFMNGELVDSVEIEAVPDITLPAIQYSPETIHVGMKFGDVKAVLGDMELARSDLPERFGAGLEIYTGDQIFLGFVNDTLEYVVTFALTVGGKGEL